MSRRNFLLIMFLITLTGLAACGGDKTGQTAAEAGGPSVSGRIEAGLRVLTFDPAVTDTVDFTVYRGDYVRLESTTGEPVTIVIPALDVNKTYPVAAGEKPYFKVPTAGEFPYSTNAASGVIRAIDFVAGAYREVSAAEGAALIDNVSPFVLDVRTPGEFSEGHLTDAHLVPVQVLQAEIGKLPIAKDKPVFVYCRSGNRSTVAAKMLIDAGFSNVVNLRGGIKEWSKAGLPVAK